jgi:hypothetical protein
MGQAGLMRKILETIPVFGLRSRFIGWRAARELIVDTADLVFSRSLKQAA